MPTIQIQTANWAVPVLREKARYRGAKGGRASGKSHLFAHMMVSRMLIDPNLKCICIREIQKSLELSSKQILTDKINQMGYSHFFEIQQNRIKRVGGEGVITFQGMQDHTAETVKSMEGFKIAWVEEAQSLSQRSLDLLDPTIRADNAEVWFSWNPSKSTDAVEELFKDNDNAVLVHANYLENPFLNKETIAMAERQRLQNIQKYNHIWLGEYVKEVEGALWTSDLIQVNRVGEDEVPELRRIVVAIDPSVTGGKNSDETGIIVAGVSTVGEQYYVLEDCSLRGSPDQWIRKAVAKYHEWQADRIIAEVNNGGDLVENLLRNTDNNVSYRSVRATRGKMLRAEPIAALYESSKVHHSGRFPELEEQMIFYNGRGNVSPDRLDALVWAVTDLSQTTGQPMWRIS
jgi:PBSX family phage terminase large subunit